MSIFRAYDIRGVYPTELNARLAFLIGAAYGELTSVDEIFLGRDVRLTSPLLSSAFAAGAMSAGLDVTDVGSVHTPLIYWLTYKNPGREGVMVTASHNPPEYNGFKISYKGKAYSYETLFARIEKEIGRVEERKNWDSVGTISYRDYMGVYIEDLLRRVPAPERRLKIVVDAGNGSCGFSAQILRELGADVKGLYLEPNGRFPNHIPDPLRMEAYGDLSKSVIDERADLGILFDGDCDRVGFVDDKGRPLGGDAATMLLARDVLRGRPGSKIVLNVLLSKAVFEYIGSLGGKPIMTRVGHSYIQDTMEKEEAPFAAEISGHFYFADNYYGFDDALYAALRMVSIVSELEDKLSAVVDGLPRYYSMPEERVRCPDEIKFKVVERLKDKYRKAGYRIIDIDGVRVELDNGWWLVRASNTEPALVLRAEASSEEELKKLQEAMKRDVREAMRELET